MKAHAWELHMILYEYVHLPQPKVDSLRTRPVCSEFLSLASVEPSPQAEDANWK